MRFVLTLLLLINLTYLFGQQRITGIIVDLKTKKQITPESESYRFYLLGKKFIAIDSVGHFEISQHELIELGDTVTLSIGSTGTDHKYADFELINIPIEKIELVTKQIFVTKTFMRPTCGRDCFTVNNRKTYKEKLIIVNNGAIKYKMRRVPEKRPDNSPFYNVKYFTDFKTDLM